MTHEHLNKWSPWHKYIRTNITNIDIPEEMSLFAELKTLTQGQQRRRTVQWKEEAAQEERSFIKRRAKKSSNELEKEKQKETRTRT